MDPKTSSDYERFVEAFAKRYEEELKYAELVPETDMLWLYSGFRGSGKETPEEWFEEQELS